MKYRTKRWHALIEFRDYLIKTKSETVIEFVGHTLVTDHGRYGLVDSALTFHSAPVAKKAVAKKAVAKKAVAKKPVAKKAVAKKPVAKRK